MWQSGWEGWGRMEMHMAESLSCSSETITTLLISYTPIQNKVLKKRKLDDYSHSNVICNWIKFGVWLRKKIQLPLLWRVVYYYLWIKTRPTYYYFSRKLKGIKISIWLKIYSGCLFQVFIIILILIFCSSWGFFASILTFTYFFGHAL